MAGLGSGLLGDIGQASRAVAKPKKKRKPVPKAMATAGVKKEPSASQKKAEVHLGAGALSGVGAVARQVAKPERKNVRTPGDAKKLALAEKALKELRAPKSRIAGLQGTAGPGELGGLAEQLKRVTTFSPETRTKVNKTGVGGSGVSLANIALLAGATPVTAAIGGAAKALSHAPGVVGRAGKDLVDFPKQAVLGTYAMGDALEAAVVHGETAKAKKIWDGLSRGAAGELLIHGDPKAALKVANEHPLYAALDFTGAESLLGRAAGAGARTAGLLGREGNALARAGALKRADLKLGDTGQVETGRRYSKDLIRKGAQVALERRRVAQGKDPFLASERVANRKLDQRGNHIVSRNEAIRRLDRADMQQVAQDLTGRRSRRGKTESARDLVQAVVEQEVRAPAAVFRHDLAEKLQRLDDVDLKELRRPEQGANNRAAAAAIRKALDLHTRDPAKFEEMRQKVVGLADEFQKHADDIEKGKIAAKSLDPDQALAARLRTYGVTRMGLRYEPSKTPYEGLAARHEAAKAVEADKKIIYDHLTSDLETARHARSRVVGQQEKARGDRAGRGESPKATDAEKAKLAAADAKIEKLRADRRQAESAWRGARRDRAGSEPKKWVTGLVDEYGRRVSTRQILEHIEADPHARMPAFVKHIEDTSGGRAFFVNFFKSRKSSENAGGVRTGNAARQGTQDASIRALGDSLVRQQGELSATEGFDRYVGSLGTKHPDGRNLTPDEAEKLYAAQFVPGTTTLRPGVTKQVMVRVVPSKYDAARQAEVEGLQKVKPMSREEAFKQHKADALKPPSAEELASQERAFALVPERQLDLFDKHQSRGQSDIGKMVTAYTGMFRNTVLPFSFKWLTGNSVEAALRLAIQDNPVGLVRSARAGTLILKAQKSLDETAWREFNADAKGGLQYGAQRQIYRGPERFEGTIAEGFARRASVLRNTPIVRIIPDRINAFTDKVFELNKHLEQYSQKVAIGKEGRREIEAMTGSWVKALTLQKKAVDDVAKGLVNTDNQIRYARAVDETLGNYTRFGPNQRAIIQTSAPFLPWYLNSARFIAHTLPAKHPVKTALLASVERTLSDDFAKEHSDAFDDLKGAIKRGDGGFVDFARYTPFGVVNGGGTSATGIFLPQFQSILFTTYGLNFTGQKLKTKNGETVEPGSTKAILLALNSAMESVVPGVGVGRRLQEQGESSYDDSTIWAPESRTGTDYGQDLPGPFGSGHGVTKAINRIANPVRPTYLHGGPSDTGGASGGGDVGAVGDGSNDIWAAPAGASTASVAASASDDDIWATP